MCVVFLDTEACCIKLRGKKENIEKMQRSVKEILQEREQDETSQIKRRRGCQAFLRHLATAETVQYPPYWKCVQKGTVDKKRSVKRRPIDPQSSGYKEIKSIVERTWEADKVGHGHDATGLGHSGIVVKKIWSVENPDLYRKYDAKRKEMCRQAAESRCPRVKGLLEEPDIFTHFRGIRCTIIAL